MSGLVLEEYRLLGDSKYRAYVTAIDKALRNFETATEWADLSSTLNKLHKVILLYMSYKVVPRRIIISRRLAQCLHPTLPAGVHLKALEIYDIIFKCMGPDRLSEELFIYSAGLFPVFLSASMHVRSALLTIYETHFVPLGQRLKPSLNGFLSGILYGLEDGSDHHERTSVLLQRIADGVGYSKFFGCLWECILHNSAVRYPAISHISFCYNKKFCTEDQLYILGDIDIMVQATCKALKDDAVLVQRACLDLIHILLPMHNTQLLKGDLTTIVSSALLVLLRRDMSLNRRFFAWMLGTEVKISHLPAEHPLVKQLNHSRASDPNGSDEYDFSKSYFIAFSKCHLITAFINVLKDASTKFDPPDFRPCRIVTALLDKSQVGTQVLDAVFFDFLRYLYHVSEGLERLETMRKSSNVETSQLTDDGKTLHDLNKSALLVFSALQPSYTWLKLLNALEDSCQHSENTSNVSYPGDGSIKAQEVSLIMKYLLQLIPLDTKQQINSAKLFEVLVRITKVLANNIKSLNSSELHSGLELCKSILSKLIPTTVQMHNENQENSVKTSNFIPPQSISQYNVPYCEENGIIQIGIEATEKKIDVFLDKKEKKLKKKKNIDDSKSVSEESSSPVSTKSCLSEEEIETTQDVPVKSEPTSMDAIKYVDEYLKLFLCYIQKRLSATGSLNFEKFESLLYIREPEHNLGLRSLLEKSMNGFKEDNVQRSTSRKMENNEYFDIIQFNSIDELEEQVFKILCSILVDLSSIPANEGSCTWGDASKERLPTWLLSLLMCIACGDKVSVKFGHIAISTLLELVMLAQSDMSVRQMKEVQNMHIEEEKRSISIYMVPLLAPTHTYQLLHHTSIYQLIATYLWDHLQPHLKEYHVSSSELLLQLHNLSLPKSSLQYATSDEFSIVEKEIMKSFTTSYQNTDEKYEKNEKNNFAMVRWITLWQVSRSMCRSSSSIVTFNRCLFLMVERLRCQFALERSYARDWLSESMYWGDLRRILDPILSFLLHPNTRRVSVQHVSIEKISHCDGDQRNAIKDLEFAESQIYAISSVGGEVMYHISKGVQRKSSLAIKKQILTYAGLSNNKFVTQKANVVDYEVPDYKNVNSSMSLLVNPFSTHPWIDFNDLTKMNPTINYNDAVRNAHSIKSETSKKKSKNAVKTIVKSLLNEIIDDVINLKEREKAEAARISKSETMLHPLHSHMLLYMQLVDSGQCLYGLNLIKNILEAEPKLFILSLASTGITQDQSPSSLLVLLARHRKSVFGEGFDGEFTSDMISQLRSNMYLQVVITICLYFIRSYYPQQDGSRTHENVLQENRELQVVAAELLCTLFTELTPLVADSPRGFNPYIKDLLNKCKVQKCVLHCLLSTALAMQDTKGTEADKSFTQDVLEYNFKTSSKVLSQEQPYLFCLMDLTLSLIKLEDVLTQSKSDLKDFSQPNPSSVLLTSLRYIIGQPIAGQPMFLCTFLLTLGQKSLRQFHASWLHLFTSALPHMGPSLSDNCLKIVSQLCKILEEIPNTGPMGTPSEYALYTLSSLTNIVHFCLLDATANSISNAVASVNSINSTHTILYNLLHVFSPSGEVLEATVDNSHVDPISCARKTLLSHLPRLVSSVLALWISTAEDSTTWSVALGSKQAIRQQIIELLSPICHHQTPYVISAFSVAWQGLSHPEESILNCSSFQKRNYIGKLWCNTKEQKALVEILSTMKVLPLHTLIDNIKEVFRHPPTIEVVGQKVPLEVNTLQLFYLYVKESTSVSQLSVCYGQFLSLIKEGLLFLPPPALLILLATLNEFVQRAPASKDKKDMKEQQEITSKLLDAVSSIAGSRLEATTWLRRNLTVKVDQDTSDSREDEGPLSVAALTVLAELLAPLLDVLYPSDEKERVLPLLVNIMTNVIPYLRNHTSSNMAAFHASSHLLASLSSYQYTLKAWRKDILELFLDVNAFKMFPETLPYWRILVDNLCTHDKTVFKEILGKISISQGGTLNIFTNKEAEYENCSCLLKRLSFTILCSDVGQHLHMIEERLTEVTRLGEIIPSLLAQELMCFRVLLLRMAPKDMSSLWPIIITELVQVFLMMEQELSTDTEQFKAHLKHMSTLDSRWVVGAYSGLHAHNNPAWLALYLSACKLLDLMVALPTSYLPQFQMYRWAFVGYTESGGPTKERKITGASFHNNEFIPHITRIAKLMNEKTSKLRQPKVFPIGTHPPGHLFLKMNTIDSLLDLHPFIATLASGDSLRMALDAPISAPRQTKRTISHIEKVIEKDFVESCI